VTTSPQHDALARTVPAKVRRRLIPFMFVLYVVSYLDRINVGFAALQMNEDLRFSPAVYGLAPGSSSSATACWRCRATWCWRASARGAGSRAS
jgi:sugar phosphate permease